MVKLAQNLKGLSTPVLLLLLIIFFLLGAVLSYIWTMGFYAPSELNLPTFSNLTIEEIKFYSEQPDFFNMTVLNPSYSPFDAKIEQINVHTNDGKSYSIITTLPDLPSLSIAPGRSETIKSYWNWANYTDQKIVVYVILAQGSGPVVEVQTAFMNLTLTSIILEPAITSTRFNITVESTASPVSVDIDMISVNGEAANATPALPYQLSPNVTVNFTVDRDWAALQNKTVTVAVHTTQGYETSKSIIAPQMELNISSVVFDPVVTSHFNLTVGSLAVSAVNVDLNSLKVYVEGQNITIDTDPDLPQALSPGSALALKCLWDWSSFKGKNVEIVIYTAQGFKTSTEAPVPNGP